MERLASGAGRRVQEEEINATGFDCSEPLQAQPAARATACSGREADISCKGHPKPPLLIAWHIDHQQGQCQLFFTSCSPRSGPRDLPEL